MANARVGTAEEHVDSSVAKGFDALSALTRGPADGRHPAPPHPSRSRPAGRAATAAGCPGCSPPCPRRGSPAGEPTVTIAERVPPGSRQLGSWIGRPFPAYCSDCGQALLSDADDEEVAPVFARTKFVRHGPNTPTGLDDFLSRPAATRRRGCSIVDEEAEPLLHSVVSWFRQAVFGQRASVAVFHALAVVFVAVLGGVVLLGCFVAGGVLREGSRRRRVVRIGSRTPARCVRTYHRAHQPAHPQRYGRRPAEQCFVLEFTGPDGDPVRFEDTSPPATTRVGDELTIAYLPDRPASAVVVAEDEMTALAQSLRILAAFCVFLMVMAGIAYIGVAILDAYASAASDPDLWIEP